MDKLQMLPRIRRARAYRLYGEDGRRYVDLWLDGGAAVLGHTPPRVLTALKDAAARGLFAPFPSRALTRLERTISRLFPGRTVLVYPDGPSADRALARAGFPALDAFLDAGTCDPSGVSTALRWRPQAGVDVPPAEVLVSPVLPFPGPGAPVVLLPPAGGEGLFAQPDPVSPVACAVAARAAADLVSQYPLRTAASCRRAAAALAGTPWVRRGIYLHRADEPTASRYELQFRRFLQAGFLIPPDPRLPLILPEDLSAGEDEALARILKTEA